MNRIDEKFRQLKAEGKKAFIPYITSGDPDMETTKRITRALVNAGADIIELGVPFSDPLADGPTIQKAIQRSLEGGCTVRKVLFMVKELRKTVQVPFVFMTYYNIIFNYGVSRFVRDAKAAGADGVIVPDLPMEESGELSLAADKEDFYLVMLAAPTTPVERFKKISKCSRGFIYYISLTGVTGARKSFSGKLKGELRELVKVSARPVCVGFGVSDAVQAKSLAEAADGVIVGSAIIKLIENGLKDKNAMVRRVKKFAASLARAVHEA
ncbi:MAG: tryptophan synthase subunit alpha [Candidatus Omnitrophota bacterium]